MPLDEARAEQTRDELTRRLARALEPYARDDASRLASELVDRFVDVTPPEATPQSFEYVTMREGGSGGGTSVKPGNVVLKLADLIADMAAGATMLHDASHAPWKLVLGLLITGNSLRRTARLELDDAHACVLWTLWTIRDGRNTVAKGDVYDAVSRGRATFGRQPLSVKEIDDALGDLVRMRCIKQSVNYRGRWWLRERVRIAKYR